MMAQLASTLARTQGATQFANYYTDLCRLQDTVPLAQVTAHVSKGPSNNIGAGDALDLAADKIHSYDWAPILNAIKINKSLNLIAIRSYFELPPEISERTVENDGKVDVNESKRNSRAVNVAHIKRRIPAIHNSSLTFQVCRSIRGCLSTSPTLKSLELQGIPFRLKDLRHLAKGLASSKHLTHLSLDQCNTGNHGLEILIAGVRNLRTLTVLNVSGCALTGSGAISLIALIRHQAIRRQSEAWARSLRYRLPDLDSLGGIRRIIANRNPLLSDEGAKAFADALKDDIWMKAIDLQRCGISNVGASSLLATLIRFNNTLLILDVRANPLIDPEMIDKIHRQLEQNNEGAVSPYRWLSLYTEDDDRRQSENKIDYWLTYGIKKSTGKKEDHIISRPQRRTKSHNSLTPLPSQQQQQKKKKMTSRDATYRSTSANGRSAATETPRKETFDRSILDISDDHKEISSNRRDIYNCVSTEAIDAHLPWRTALRAIYRTQYHSPARRSRSLTGHPEIPVEGEFPSPTMMKAILKSDQKNHQKKGVVDFSPDDGDMLLHRQPYDKYSPLRHDSQRGKYPKPATQESSRDDALSSVSHSPGLKELVLEIRILREQLLAESDARRKADERVFQLMEENRRLTRQLNDNDISYRHRHDDFATKDELFDRRDASNDVDTRKVQYDNRLEDKDFSTSEEYPVLLRDLNDTISRFHGFLNHLKNKGLGNLIDEYAELMKAESQTKSSLFPVPSKSSSIKGKPSHIRTPLSPPFKNPSNDLITNGALHHQPSPLLSPRFENSTDQSAIIDSLTSQVYRHIYSTITSMLAERSMARSSAQPPTPASMAEANMKDPTTKSQKESSTRTYFSDPKVVPAPHPSKRPDSEFFAKLLADRTRQHQEESQLELIRQKLSRQQGDSNSLQPPTMSMIETAVSPIAPPVVSADAVEKRDERIAATSTPLIANDRLKEQHRSEVQYGATGIPVTDDDGIVENANDVSETDDALNVDVTLKNGTTLNTSIVFPGKTESVENKKDVKEDITQEIESKGKFSVFNLKPPEPSLISTGELFPQAQLSRTPDLLRNSEKFGGSSKLIENIVNGSERSPSLTTREAVIARLTARVKNSTKSLRESISRQSNEEDVGNIDSNRKDDYREPSSDGEVTYSTDKDHTPSENSSVRITSKTPLRHSPATSSARSPEGLERYHGNDEMLDYFPSPHCEKNGKGDDNDSYPSSPSSTPRRNDNHQNDGKYDGSSSESIPGPVPVALSPELQRYQGPVSSGSEKTDESEQLTSKTLSLHSHHNDEEAIIQIPLDTKRERKEDSSPIPSMSSVMRKEENLNDNDDNNDTSISTHEITSEELDVTDDVITIEDSDED